MTNLQDYISECLHDPWSNTEHKGYVYLTPKQKGRYGELYVKNLMEKMLCKVDKPDTTTSGYDWEIDGILTEVKFSLACRKNNKIKPDTFIINHVSVGKCWERLIFCGINPDNKHHVYITKDDFIQELNREDTVFNHQQGGKGIANDDYMCTNFIKLLARDYVKQITEW